MLGVFNAEALVAEVTAATSVGVMQEKSRPRPSGNSE
jgi:hypothetical protein